MSARGYGEHGGTEYGADDRNRDRWRERDERSGWRGEHRGRDEDRGFFERAGEEIRSWFGDDDDHDRRRARDVERGSGHLREQQQRFGRGGWGGQDWERERSHRGPGGGRGDTMGEQRSSFGGMAQSGMSGRGDWEHRQRDYGAGSRERFGEGRSMQHGGRGEEFGRGGWGGQRSDRSGHAQSWGQANRGESGESLGYSEFGGMLGGFGNQRFASSQDELYRRWRDRQMEQLDREYEEYCRDCEQKFHQDFDSWRRNRQSQSQGQGMSQGQQGSDELILGGGSTGSAASGGTAATSSSASDTTGSTEMAGAGGTSDSDLGTGSGSGRSGSRSRS